MIRHLLPPPGIVSGVLVRRATANAWLILFVFLAATLSFIYVCIFYPLSSLLCIISFIAAIHGLAAIFNRLGKVLLASLCVSAGMILPLWLLIFLLPHIGMLELPLFYSLCVTIIYAGIVLGWGAVILTALGNMTVTIISFLTRPLAKDVAFYFSHYPVQMMASLLNPYFLTGFFLLVLIWMLRREAYRASLAEEMAPFKKAVHEENRVEHQLQAIDQITEKVKTATASEEALPHEILDDLALLRAAIASEQRDRIPPPLSRAVLPQKWYDHAPQ